MNRTELVETVLDSLREVLESMDEAPAGAPVDEATVLMGDGAVLDSMRVVSLIVDVEQRLEESVGVSLTIADERAMSMRRSPFRTVGSMVDYLQVLLQERGA